MEVLAIIPARSGSKGVLNKNITNVAGHPLLAWSVAAAKQSSLINRVIVSTDSEEYAKIANLYGAETPFLRPTELAQDSSIDRQFLIHALNWLKTNDAYFPDVIVLLRPTSPLRNPHLVDEGIRLFLSTPGATSLCSAHATEFTPVKWFRKDGLYFHGLITEGCHTTPRQLCPKTYIPNGYVDVICPDTILSCEDFYSPNILAYVTPAISDLDTLSDYESICDNADKQSNILHDWLDNIASHPAGAPSVPLC